MLRHTSLLEAAIVVLTLVAKPGLAQQQPWLVLNVDPIAVDNIQQALASGPSDPLASAAANLFLHVDGTISLTPWYVFPDLWPQKWLALAITLQPGSFDINWFIAKGYVYHDVNLGLALDFGFFENRPLNLDLTFSFSASNSSPFAPVAPEEFKGKVDGSLWYGAHWIARNANKWHQITFTGNGMFSLSQTLVPDFKGAGLIKYVLRDADLDKPLTRDTRLPWFSLEAGVEYDNTVYYDHVAKILIPAAVVFDQQLIKSINFLGIRLNHPALRFEAAYQIQPTLGFDRLAINFSGNP